MFQSLNRASLHFDTGCSISCAAFGKFQSLNRASLHFDALKRLRTIWSDWRFNPSIGLPYISTLTDAIDVLRRILGFNPSIGLPYISTLMGVTLSQVPRGFNPSIGLPYISTIEASD